jgi:hypothetical protein
MSNKAPSDEEVAARVRAAVAADFQAEQVNSFPVKPEEGYYDLVIPLSYHYSTFAIGSIVFFPIFLRLMPILPGDDQRPVL